MRDKMEANKMRRINDFIDRVNNLDFRSIQHAGEINRDRWRDVHMDWQHGRLLKHGFLTADFPIYTIERDEVVLYLADRNHNLILGNINDAVMQLAFRGNYFPLGNIKNITKNSLKLKYSDLNIENIPRSKEAYLHIDADKYSDVSPAQKKLIDRIIRYDPKLPEMKIVLGMLGIKKLSFEMLNQDYAERELSQNGAKAIGRMAYLSDIYSDTLWFNMMHDTVDKDHVFRGYSYPQDSKNISISLDDLIEYSNNFIPAEFQKGFEAAIKERYGRK